MTTDRNQPKPKPKGKPPRTSPRDASWQDQRQQRLKNFADRVRNVNNAMRKRNMNRKG